MTAALIPSVSIEALLQRRDAIVEKLTAAHKALGEVHQLANAQLGDHVGFLGYELRLEFASSRGRSRDLTEERGLEYAIRRVDAKCWDFLLAQSGLWSFMDATTREAWNKSIDEDEFPLLTRENITATFAKLYDERGAMFEQGVIALFRNLSWAYKTNQPVKLGKRIVVKYVVEKNVYARRSETYGISHGGANKLDDIIRVMSILDGKPEPDHRNGAYHTANNVRFAREGGTMQLDLEYMHVRGFKNGNAHVTFKRLDLVDGLNRIIAKHFPNALPATREDAQEGDNR